MQECIENNKKMSEDNNFTFPFAEEMTCLSRVELIKVLNVWKTYLKFGTYSNSKNEFAWINSNFELKFEQTEGKSPEVTPNIFIKDTNLLIRGKLLYDDLVKELNDNGFSVEIVAVNTIMKYYEIVA